MREQSEADFRELERSRDLPPDEPYAGHLEVPECPSCCDTDEVRFVYDGVEFVGYECERCEERWS